MRLTQNEAAIILHRLEVPDAIAEALFDGEPTNQQNEAVYDICKHLTSTINANRTIDDNVNGLPLRILIDAVEGSTYAASTDNEREQRTNVIRGQMLAKKMSIAFNEKIRFPAA